MTAIKEIMESTTNGLVVITKSKDNAVDNIQNDYDKILFDWDKTKTDLNTETKIAIANLTNAMYETSQMSITQRTIKVEIDETRVVIDKLGNTLDDVIENQLRLPPK